VFTLDRTIGNFLELLAFRMRPSHWSVKTSLHCARYGHFLWSQTTFGQLCHALAASEPNR
jgi:hypothetical protein